MKGGGVVFVSLFALFGVSCSYRPGPEEPLIGWKGETYNPKSTWEVQEQRYGSNGSPPHSDAFEEKNPFVTETWVQVLSEEPRSFYYPNLLSDEECDHIIKSALPQMKKSVVFDKDGKLIVDGIRTSYGTFLRRLQDDIIANVTARVARVTHIPVSHQEDMQVLRYGQHQYYKAHQDTSKAHMKTARVATMLLYLSDVEEGGETSFPLTNVNNPEWELKNGPFSDCAKNHVSIKPRKGDAFLFFSVKPDGSIDPLSKHMGCAVEKGVKWTATVWSHSAPYQTYSLHKPTPEEEPEDPGFCDNHNDQCEEWAAEGECEKNPDYMVGDGGNNYGTCRKACKVCMSCQKGDIECYKKNRERAGYLTLDEIFNPDWSTKAP